MSFADDATNRVIELRQKEACEHCDEHLKKCEKHHMIGISFGTEIDRKEQIAKISKLYNKELKFNDPYNRAIRDVIDLIK